MQLGREAFGLGTRGQGRTGQGLSSYMSACLTLLCLCLLSTVTAQRQNGGDRAAEDVDRRPSASYEQSGTTASIPTPSSTSGPVSATQSPVALVESQVIQATLDIGSSSPAQFYLTAPFKNVSHPLYVTATLCTGPAIPPYDVNNGTLLKQLNMDYWQAVTSTQLSMYVSTNADNKVPGPSNTQGSPDVQYFFGGLATDVNTDKQPDGAWISVYPPQDARNMTGTWTFLIGASTEGPPLTLQKSQGLWFADSDRENALISTFNASQGLSPNFTLAILPTEGPLSLQDASYFNSSVCAISTAFNRINATSNLNRPVYNRSETMRGSMYANTTRIQWAVSNLQPNTNYSAWLFDIGPASDTSSMTTTTMWPAIKFVTKRSQTCRLVYDVDFCPNVAYSIPIAPSVSTGHALSIIGDTVSPNFANFSATLDTFPCDSDSFGQYSPLKTCSDCRRAYRDWLCAVTMPRCTDPLPTVSNDTSAAVPDPFDLLGIETPLNTRLLPYVINRQGDSRQNYIDSAGGLDAGLYGELLPCIYTCYEVANSCPQPLIQWYCPLWDITAQAQYGTFADAGEGGLGAGANGGAGSDGQRWGGPTRYIAQDSFGNVYCNSMSVERRLVALNAATRKNLPSPLLIILLPLVAALTALVVT